MSTADPIRTKDQLHQMSAYFLERGQFRNNALIVLGVYTALRISDLLRLKWDDVYDEPTGRFRSHLCVTEQKTGKQKTIALHQQAIHALRLYLPYRRSAYLFASRKGDRPISRTQAWRIISNAAAVLGVSGNISCHSLRKTWGYHAWTSQAVSPVVIMEIYNHSSYDVTKRYLGVAQDDLDKAYLDMTLF